jgi:hypothetical protein
MNRRRITPVLGAAAGGLLGAAFLPAAVAFADSYQIIPDPGSTEDVTSFYGVITTPPAVTGVEGEQEFDVVDTTTNTVVGKFDALEGNTNEASLLGGTNEELLVTSDVSGNVGTTAGDTPPVDSVIDIYNYYGVFQSVYSAVPTASGDVVSYDWGSALGDIPVSSNYNAAAGIAGGTLDQHNLPLADGYYFAPAVGSSESFTGITGLSPYDVAVQGEQVFDVYNSAGVQVGTFDGDVTNTSDEFGNYTEAVLVTSDGTASTVGTAAGDVPPVDSVFNIFYHGNNDDYNIYSAMPSASGDAISDTLVTPFGDYAIPTTFDAETASDTSSLDLPGGDSFVPVGTEQLAGINGLPPLDVAIQGYQQFDVDNSTGTQIGSFDADVATHSDLLGNYSEAILVTNDTAGTVGTGTGDVPPVGSEFDILYHGNSGFATIYSDLASPSGDVLSETFVTPFGDFTIPTALDPSAGLTADSFVDPLPAQSDALLEPLQALASLLG